MGLVERFFRVQELGSSVKTEILAGITTFLSMAYIVVVNPIMLAEVGIPLEAAFGATVLASLLPTLIMAFFANAPLALAPGMGVNAFFAYTLVLGMGLSWQSALGAVFASGLLFLLVALTPLPRYVMEAIPQSLRVAIGVGIGLFIALLGFQNAGLVKADEATMLALGNMADPAVLLALGGLLLIGVLTARKVQAAILISILLVTVLAMAFGISPAPKNVGEVVQWGLPDIAPTLFAMDFAAVLEVSFISVLFTMTMVDMFNAMGTIVGLAPKAGMLQQNAQGKSQVRGLKAAFVADSSGTLMAGLLGTSPVTSYLESVTGIAEGGRTGLTALTVAVLFVICLPFAPLVALIPAFATAPALIFVGALMMQEIRDIHFEDITEALPAFITLFAMPVTYSIVTGFGLGFISYVVIKLLSGKRQQLNPVLYGLAVLFLLHFMLG